VPFPLLDTPEVTVSHEALLTAVQKHPTEAVTERVPVPMLNATKALAGLRLYEHPTGTPACVTVKVWPAMVSVPERGVPVGLAANEYPTVPIPLPDAPEVTVSHTALLTAVQEHPAEAATKRETVPLLNATEALVGLRL
jgi:hypothetical protein